MCSALGRGGGGDTLHTLEVRVAWTSGDSLQRDSVIGVGFIRNRERRPEGMVRVFDRHHGSFGGRHEFEQLLIAASVSQRVHMCV